MLHIQDAIQFATDRFPDLSQNITRKAQDPDLHDLCADLLFVCQMEDQTDGPIQDRYSVLRTELEDELKSLVQPTHHQPKSSDKG